MQANDCLPLRSGQIYIDDGPDQAGPPRTLRQFRARPDIQPRRVTMCDITERLLHGQLHRDGQSRGVELDECARGRLQAVNILAEHQRARQASNQSEWYPSKIASNGLWYGYIDLFIRSGIARSLRSSGHRSRKKPLHPSCQPRRLARGHRQSRARSTRACRRRRPPSCRRARRACERVRRIRIGSATGVGMALTCKCPPLRCPRSQCATCRHPQSRSSGLVS